MLSQYILQDVGLSSEDTSLVYTDLAFHSNLFNLAFVGGVGELGEVRVATANTGVQDADVQPIELVDMPAN